MRIGVEEFDAGGCARGRDQDGVAREQAQPGQTRERGETGQVLIECEPAVPGAEAQRAQPGIFVAGEVCEGISSELQFDSQSDDTGRLPKLEQPIGVRVVEEPVFDLLFLTRRHADMG